MAEPVAAIRSPDDRPMTTSRPSSEVLTSDFLTTGPEVAAFEAELAAATGASHAAVLNSGTSALHAAYAAMGVGPGDEIVTSPMTFAATGNAALYLGARPVFVDVDPSTGLIDPTLGRGRDHQPHPSHRRHRLRGSASRLRRARTDRRAARHPDRRGCRAFARSHRSRASRRHARRRHGPLVPSGEADHDRRGRGGRSRTIPTFMRGSSSSVRTAWCETGRDCAATTGRGTRRCRAWASTTA